MGLVEKKFVHASSRWAIVLAMSLMLSTLSWAQSFDSRKDSKPEDNLLQQYYRDDVSAVFDETVSVQKRAKRKAGHLLFNPYYSIDFSDTPYTMWAPNLNLGYAQGEFFEFFLNFAPTFNNTERFISKEVKKLTLESGESAVIGIEKAKSQLGLEINWVPIYGKDAWGPYRIVRSDTFFNLGFYRVQYETKAGNKFKLGLGKTFFIYPWLNLRLVGAMSSIQYATPSGMASNLVGLFEFGLVFYL